MNTIPQELLEKYNVGSIEMYAVITGESIEGQKQHYQEFLNKTDHITNKIVEGVATSVEYSDELYYREVARQELDKLNGGTGEAVEAKPLDVVGEQNRADIDFIAMMSDIEL